VLSALPLVSAGNLCCCLWVVTGGVVAAYLLQQNQATPVTAGDGALVGLLAGLVGAVVYLILSIPITILVAPLERALMERVMENARNMPVEVRDYMGTVGSGVRIVAGFLMMLVAGAVFSTIGGLIGAAIFVRRPPPGVIDIPPSA
jgi:hypothetical protein